jgi:hypothetical protein
VRRIILNVKIHRYAKSFHIFCAVEQRCTAQCGGVSRHHKLTLFDPTLKKSRTKVDGWLHKEGLRQFIEQFHANIEQNLKPPTSSKKTNKKKTDASE